MQVFENEDGVVAFVEVDLVTRRPGLVRSPPVVRSPVRLFRFDVGREGTVKRLALKSADGQRGNLWLDDILKLPQGLYLAQSPSSGKPSYRLHRIGDDRIEPLSKDEADPILRSLGSLDVGRLRSDAISARNGWRLLERRRSSPGGFEEPIVSTRHQLRLRVDVGDEEQRLVAESLGEGDRWITLILTTETRRWWSYRRPPRE